MSFLRAPRAKLVWALELALGLELYACAVLALHARGLRAAPLLASPGLVIPALVIPPVFYVLVGLVSVRPLALWRVIGATGAMCGVHAALVMATGALFVIPDLVDYGAAVAFSLWGSPAVTMLQLTAAPLVLARLRPLIVGPRPGARGAPARREPVAPTPTPSRESPAAAPRPTAVTPRATAPAAASLVARPDRRALVEPAEPMIRVAFSRIADQLPVEMFARGRKGLSDTLRPGVSLFVPRRLLLPHLAQGVAPVKWEVVADQFPRDELVLTHAEIEKRLPDGSLLLPLDEVVPQIPAELLARSTPATAVSRTEELPPPVQLHVPPPPVTAAVAVDEVSELDVQELAALILEAQKPEAPELEAAEPEVGEPDEAELEAAEQEAAEIEVADVAEAETEPAAPAPAKPQPAEPEAPRPAAVVFQAPSPQLAPEPRRSREANGIAVGHGRPDELRRIATLLAPVMNGLEIGERDGAGTPLVTAIAPTLPGDVVVATALRVLPWLSDPRLPEPVSQVTLAAAEATIVLTPFGSPGSDALLVAAVASRASLARLERLSRSAAGEPPSAARNGTRVPEGSDPARELRATVVPPSIRELASSLTAFGPVAPAMLRDAADLFRVCLFGPGALEPAPLAQLARDLFGALEGTTIGPVTSVVVRLGTYRLVVRALGSSAGQTTILVAVGSTARPGLARIELERAVKVIGRG